MEVKLRKYHTIEQKDFFVDKNKNLLARPFLKWAGGKRQLLKEYKNYIPINRKVYYESFVGAGAVLFHLQPKKAYINDKNEELINCYKVIKDNVEELIQALHVHRNEKEYFYELRDVAKSPEFKSYSDVTKAARIIYLNKTCYNGLFRVNSQGFFNVPFGKYNKPNIVDEIVLRAVNQYLNNNDVAILNEDFALSLEGAQKDDFVYLDPPYDPISETSSFTGYNLDKFSRSEQERLRDCVENLTSKGCKVMLSNSSTDYIKELYSDKQFTIKAIPAIRSINSISTGRGKIDELLIMNYEI